MSERVLANCKSLKLFMSKFSFFEIKTPIVLFKSNVFFCKFGESLLIEFKKNFVLVIFNAADPTNAFGQSWVRSRSEYLYFLYLNKLNSNFFFLG